MSKSALSSSVSVNPNSCVITLFDNIVLSEFGVEERCSGANNHRFRSSFLFYVSFPRHTFGLDVEVISESRVYKQVLVCLQSAVQIFKSAAVIQIKIKYELIENKKLNKNS